MRFALPLLPLIALACAKSNDSGLIAAGTPATGLAAGLATGGASSGTSTGTPGTAALSWTSDPGPVDIDGGIQHHISVALTGGIPWVTYQRDAHVRTRRIDPTLGAQLIDDTAPIGFNHPNIDASGLGVFAAASLDIGGLAGQSWDPAGNLTASPLWLDNAGGELPTVSATQTGALFAWVLDGGIHCATWTGTAAPAVAVSCPAAMNPAYEVHTLEVDLGPTGWITWSEAAPGTPATVGLAPCDLAGARPGFAAATAIDASWDARPDVAATEAGGLLVWRGATGPTLPRYAWIAAFVAADQVAEPRAVGGAGSDRPVVAAAAELGVVAWEEAGIIWVEPVDARTGSARGPALQASTSGSAARPSLALEATDLGWRGVIGWEQIDGAASTVRIRTFDIGL